MIVPAHVLTILSVANPYRKGGRHDRHHHKEATAWKLPDLDTVYHCEELGPMTLGQMLDGVDPDLVPSDQTMYEDLLWAFGAWDTLEQMNAAMATRVYVADPDGTVGFKLVK